ncbi:polyprenyl synthetase family protein [Microbacterium esteraromaticum]|uniref:Polyprenyl synthetase family protein n=1 Tax=Microbacterium esteraromaticum TaxID=57043 RepID=A0A939DWH4_9MICO|nr:polyprenyl synthetase family protein [Microbacterium esteraromaticum]MBN7794516.1 polyprenyl synthetase family protein [Microbacterium esteraromaticum]MBN8206605.1 polyprenyl synthetase family protein [Microbacterium esteraromaticum]MBN8416760.1 polyprenyl synthetase family protein [Microbacterium esteraromaticum]MBN8425387.1 polyprenyl synthetase family protein [Microbacterium esteraromaticum]MBY6061510.1 polyprenyl synthetase family protein [Microbacterium esteraromaticum]
MTSSPASSGTRLASRLGFSDRVFLGPAARRIAARIDEGLDLVESTLASEVKVADPVTDAATRYLYEAGGKRIRPVLALLTAQLGDGNITPVIEIAAALELTHLGSLYHDDVMDGADTRRGVPAAHAVWGNNVAILTGDILFSRASQIMSRYGDRAMRLQADTFERLVMGQMHETVGAQPDDDPIEFYLQVLADKTGSLIAAATQGGAIFSNAPAEYEEPLRVYGEKVGVAFQLLDDVIDLSADAEETGKVPGTDLRAGVPTMPSLLLKTGTSDADIELARRIDDGVARIAEGADPALLDGPLAELRDHEATARTMDLARTWTSDAIAALAPLPKGAVREALTRFAETLADRSS